ncbi:hypothetical protein AND_001759 [Anopheles darlingi]|uniref:Mediator of RNA polymerase II transcription subunit 13 n=1 Tax=Anopheles darlingi TaxID=43151 RepID=W5JUN2_ANODA|nr:hypothetical protein AND_001759 [Anopheles darlingi]
MACFDSRRTPPACCADLCGIRWRQLVYGERPNASSDPLDDPVLRSYSKCLAVDILCVWRRVAAPKPKPKLDPDPSSMFDMSIPGTGNSGSVLHPPLSLTAAKELWIFWYGEEPDLTELVAPELLNSSGKSKDIRRSLAEGTPKFPWCKVNRKLETGDDDGRPPCLSID